MYICKSAHVKKKKNGKNEIMNHEKNGKVIQRVREWGRGDEETEKNGTDVHKYFSA
jgi:hypothetical protein